MTLSDEHRMLQELVAKFVDNELMPLEKGVLAREQQGQPLHLTPEEETPLLAKCRELGLWALDAPEEFGGADLPAVALVAVNEELGRTVVPFTFPPDSPNLHMLKAVASDMQRKRYLEPYAAGTAKSAIAISEPGAGLTVRRLQIGSWCVGISRRALDMMCAHAKERVTFGVRLSDRQAIQWWIADAATKIHACRLMVYDAAEKQDRGEDVRTEASMIKVFATEMASEIVDNAMQAFGAMGVTKEMPLQLFAQRLRVMRVYEGPSEVHRMVIARRTLANA